MRGNARVPRASNKRIIRDLGDIIPILIFDRFCEPEINEMECRCIDLLPKHDVIRFDVSMNDILFVELFDPVDKLNPKDAYSRYFQCVFISL